MNIIVKIYLVIVNHERAKSGWEALTMESLMELWT